MDNNDINLVLTACEKIAKSGRKPTTATIKHALPASYPFPLIIKGLKFWESLQSKQNVSAENNNSTPVLSHDSQVENSPFSKDPESALDDLMKSLSTQGGHTIITDISHQMTPKTENATPSISRDKIKTISDEAFVEMSISKQLLYIKKLLEIVANNH